MLVGIDASRAIADRPTGTETYSRLLIRALLALESTHRFRLYFRSPPPPELFPGAQIRTIPFPRLWTHVRLALEMARNAPDLLFVPAHVLPFIRPRRSLVTIHDLGYLAFPRAHTWRQRLYLDLSTRWSVHAASHVLTDSTATKDDLVALYGTEPEKVTVAHPGIDESLRPVRDPAAIEAAKTRYGISGDYYLYLGTLQPRKNLKRLVRAFARFIAQRPSPSVQLVLAGQRGWFHTSLLREIEQSRLSDQVCLPGYVSQEDKAPLLSGAIAFLFPSLHEGFGLPVLEAQACGCPVIASSTSSLPEVAGTAALLVDPRDSDAIARAIRRIATEPGLRMELVKRGFVNVERFSWKACAETVLDVIEAQ